MHKCNLNVTLCVLQQTKGNKEQRDSIRSNHIFCVEKSNIVLVACFIKSIYYVPFFNDKMGF